MWRWVMRYCWWNAVVEREDEMGITFLGTNPYALKKSGFQLFQQFPTFFLYLKIKNKIKIKHISNHQKFIWFFQKMNHDSNMQISQGELENVLKTLHE